MQTIGNQKTNQNHAVFLLLSLTLLLLMRLLPLLKGRVSTFGYDYGFYFFEAKNDLGLPWQDFLTSISGGYNNPLFYIFNLLHLPPELSLNLSYFAFTILLGLSLYWFFSKINKTAGIFTVALYAFSTVQMESFLIFLYKNAFTLPFMILGFKWLMEAHGQGGQTSKNSRWAEHPVPEGQSSSMQIRGPLGTGVEKRWRLFIGASILIILTHRTTGIIYLLTIAPYITWLLIKSKQYKLLSALTAISALVITGAIHFLNLKSSIVNLVSNNNPFVRDGIFLPFNNPLWTVWPVLLLAIPGIVMYIKRKENSLPIFFFAATLLWLIFQLPFYRRVWIYFDLSLIIFAAYFLSLAIQKTKLSKTPVIIIVIVIVLFLGYRAVSFTLAKEPLILPSEITEIKNFNRPKGFILAVSANDAPWLLAYANGYRLGAPGLLEDPHTYAEWLEFWDGYAQRQFISKYPQPLYFYERSWRLSPVGLKPCLISLTQNFSEIDFPCVEKTLP